MKPTKQVTTKEHKINRKIMILKSGLTQAEIARRLSVNPDNQRICRQAVTNEMSGLYKSARIRLGICQLLNIAPEIFWPEFYSSASPSTPSTVGATPRGCPSTSSIPSTPSTDDAFEQRLHMVPFIGQFVDEEPADESPSTLPPQDGSIN